MGRPKECNPCCGRQRNISSPGYCTHRRYDDAGSSGTLVWSRNIHPSQRLLAAVFAIAVGDDGNVYSAGTLNQVTSPDGVVEARDADGTFLWRTGIEARPESIAFSGGAVWVVGNNATNPGLRDNVFKLDPADGSILWSGHLNVTGTGGHATEPLSVIPDGSGGIYAGGNFGYPGQAFLVRLNSAGAEVSEYTFGGFTTAHLERVVRDSDGSLYVAGDFEASNDCYGGEPGGRRGPLVRLNSAYQAQWVTVTNVRPTIGISVAVTSDAAYVGFANGCLWKVNKTTARITAAKRATGLDSTTGCPGLNDMAASPDGSTIYVANGKYLVAHDAGDLSVAWCEKHGGVVDGEEVSCCYYAVAAGSTGTSPAGQIAYAGGCAAGCDPSFLSPAPSCSSTACSTPPECECGSIGPFGGTIVNCDCEEVPCSHRFPIVSTCSALNGGWIDWKRDLNNPLKWKGLVFTAAGVGTGEYFDVTYDCNSVVNGGWSIVGSPGISNLSITSWWCADGAPAGSSFPGFAGTFDISWGQERCEDVCLVFGTGECPAPGVEFCGCETNPPTLHADITLGSFSTTVTLTFDETLPGYRGSFSCGSCSMSVTLACLGGGGVSLIMSPTSGPGACSNCGISASGSKSCDPFEAHFSVPISDPSDPAICNMACGDGDTWEIDIYE